MAEDPTPQPAPKQGPGAPLSATGKSLQKLIWGVIITLLMMVISLPTVLMVLFGLLPTIVAWLIDRTGGKFATFCVGGMNFSGLFPFLGDVWFTNHSIDGAQKILTNVFDLMVIYGAAGFGWMLYLAVPPVVTTFLSVMSQRRVTVLRANQAKIIEEWGDAVTQVIEIAEAGLAQAGAPEPPPEQRK